MGINGAKAHGLQATKASFPVDIREFPNGFSAFLVGHDIFPVESQEDERARNTQELPY